jgi:hypothetical protein
VAGAGALGWALLLEAGFVAGIVAWGIGWAMGGAMQRSTGGRTNRALQVAAVLLTYASIAGGYATLAFWHREEQWTPALVLQVFATSLQAPFAQSSPLTWLIIAFFFRYSSLAALVSAVFAPFYYAMFWSMDVTTLAIGAMSLMLVWRHRGNVEKLLAGTESRLGAKAKG